RSTPWGTGAGHPAEKRGPAGVCTTPRGVTSGRGAPASADAARTCRRARTASRRMRVARAQHRRHRIGLVAALVGPVAYHAGETQRDTAGIVRARLDVVEGDLDHELDRKSVV